jgi:hypothetical protein
MPATTAYRRPPPSRLEMNRDFLLSAIMRRRVAGEISSESVTVLYSMFKDRVKATDPPYHGSDMIAVFLASPQGRGILARKVEERRFPLRLDAQADVHRRVAALKGMGLRPLVRPLIDEDALWP